MPTHEDLFRSASLLILLGAAAVLDVRTRRIPNWLTVTGLLTGLALALGAGGWPWGLSALGGAGAALATGFLLFALGVLGAGDAKLLAAVGAHFGLSQVVGAMGSVAVCGGVLALVHAGRQGIILPALFATGRMIGRFFRFGTGGGPRPEPASGRLGEVPYGLAIAVGSTIWWFLGVPFP